MAATALTNRLTDRVKAVAVVTAPAPPRVRRSSRPRSAILAFAVTVVAVNLGLAVGMDHAFPAVRDPEYGRRLAALRARRAEHPGRPLALVLGSSRTAMGLRPADVEATRPTPLVFNYAVLGGGPVMQVMTLRRLLADGVTPDAIVFEYWPAFLRQDGPFAEEGRIDPHRLLPIDRAFVRDYFVTADPTQAIMRHVRWRPAWEHRRHLLSQSVPGWLPWDKRLDGAWGKLDGWGWLPGFEADPTPAERAQRHAHARQFYDLAFAGYRVDPLSDKAFRELLGTCRGRGIRAGLVWLPESTEFRSWYPPAVLAEGERYAKALCHEFGVPLTDARDWVPDPHLADGFHLTRPGAAVFSRKLAAALPGCVR